MGRDFPLQRQGHGKVLSPFARAARRRLDRNCRYGQGCHRDLHDKETVTMANYR
jgi:hypothetical protein